MTENSIYELCNSVNLDIFLIGTAYNCSSNKICRQQIVFIYIVAILLNLNVFKLILNI